MDNLITMNNGIQSRDISRQFKKKVPHAWVYLRLGLLLIEQKLQYYITYNLNYCVIAWNITNDEIFNYY